MYHVAKPTVAPWTRTFQPHAHHRQSRGCVLDLYRTLDHDGGGSHPSRGGENPLISLSRLLTFGLFVGFVWWFVRSPIMATAGLMLAGLIGWSWPFGWTPEAW